MFNIIVFVSGNGTNLEEIINACKSGVLDASVKLVVSNKSDAFALNRAASHNIDTLVMPFAKSLYKDRNNYDLQLAKSINNHDYDLIVLAGWMHIFTNSFLNNVKSPVINLHPSLPNQFAGKNSIERAIEAFNKGQITETGMMVHYVIEEIDAGEVINTQTINIRKNDTVDTLKTRIQYYEKSLLISSIDKVLCKPSYCGKVRNIYDFNNLLIIETTDRLSAFDKHICHIPQKGNILTNLTAFFFKSTKHIIDNHYISHYNNLLICKKCKPFKIEVVVRAYITGSTETSLWTHYNTLNKREYCGNKLPNGLTKNQKLIETIVTPTTKGTKDEPISENDIIERKIMTKDEWNFIKMKSLELFRYGQYVAEGKGLILVDTKYEFGKDENNNIILIDEMHTCDSSRYWLAHTYPEKFRKGLDPDSLDKDVIRKYISNLCDPYKDDLPEIPTDLINQTSSIYIKLYEMLTDSKYIYESNKKISVMQYYLMYLEPNALATI